MVTKRLMTAAAIPIVAIALLSAACSIGKTKAPYEKLGEGNLKVVYLDGETYLASESVPGEGYAAAAAYKLEDGMPTPEPIEEITLRATSIVDDIDVKCLKVRGTVVSCEYGIEHSPDRTRFLFADGSGIWIADADGSNVRNLAERGFAETLDLATSVEPKIMMNWASHSKWADDRTIVFSSNRDAVPDDWSDSLWIVDTESGEASKIADAVPDGAAYVVLHVDRQSVVAWGSDYVYKHILGSGHTYQYELNGSPFSVSEDGRYVLYNELDETATALPDISILDLQSGRISRVQHQQNHHIYNGAWNEENTAFAFCSASFEEQWGQLFVLNLKDDTVRRIGIPDKLGHIDRHGAISWLGGHLVINTDQGAWKIDPDRM